MLFSIARVFVVVPLALFATAVRADATENAIVDDRATAPSLKDGQVRGPYCGVQSLYICLAAMGFRTDPDSYISKEFIGSSRGSSAAELIRCAEYHRAVAEPFSHLTHRELIRCKNPMILHMRPRRGGTGYEHWAAFLGFEGDLVKLYDPSTSMQLLPVAEVLANWDGTAIAVSDKSIAASFVQDAWMDMGLAGAILLCVLFGLKRWVGGETDRLLATGRQVVLVLGISLLSSAAFHCFSEVGFIRNSAAVADVKRRFHSIDVAEVTLGELQQMLKGTETLLVDARLHADFRQGTLPGAINVPVDSSLSERQQVLTGTSLSQQIIVFCHSSRCGYADDIAQFLLFNGFHNVKIFRGGFLAWSAAQGAARLP